MTSKPSIHATPIESFIDEQVNITIDGCRPNEEITLHAYVKDDKNEPFRSTATFMTNKDGIVSISSVTPKSGTYSDADASGIFWAMNHDNKKHGDYFSKTSSNELKIDLTLEIEHAIVDQIQIIRHFGKNKVTRTEIKENGTVGVLYQPIETGVYQNVVLLAGSDGEKLEHSAALLASKGYNVLDLAYFNQEGVPKDLEKIPLEYFYRSFQFLKNISKNPAKITIVGYSRGAELALLLASTYDEFNAVIAGSPSAYITSGLKNMIYAPIPSWYLNGEAKPYLKFRYRPTMMLSFFSNWIFKKPVSFLGIWNGSLKTLNDADEARIKVEDIQAPVLLISGGQDKVWPSSTFAGMIMEKLSDVEHLYYENAGHFLAFPYTLPNMPSNVYVYVGGRMIMDFGGSKSANAAAARDSWPKICSFIEAHQLVYY